jgi:hypothetical protein
MGLFSVKQSYWMSKKCFKINGKTQETEIANMKLWNKNYDGNAKDVNFG